MKTRQSLYIAIIIGLTLSLIMGCGGSSGSSDSANFQAGSIVEGDVATFIAGDIIFKQQRNDGLIARILKTINDKMITPAHAQLDGVRVEIVELGLVATTNPDGVFRFTDVPAGEYTLAFTYNGSTETMPIDVPPNAIVTIDDIIIENGSISVGDIEIEAIDDDDDNDSEDDESVDDESEDDDSIDDISEDHESIDDPSEDDDNSQDDDSEDNDSNDD